MAGFMERLPDLSGLLDVSNGVQGQLDGLFNTLDNFQNLLPSDIGEIFGSLESKLNIDVSDLTTQFPNALKLIETALPPEAAEQIDLLVEGYNTINELLKNAQETPASEMLKQLANAILGELVDLITAELRDWAGDKVDPATIDQVMALLDKLQNMRGAFPTTPEEIVPFVNENFIGISPEMLEDPLNHMDEILGVVSEIDPEALGLSSAIPPTLQEAYDQLVSKVESIDPGAAQNKVVTALNQLDSGLQTIETFINEANATFQTGYDKAVGIIDAYQWDTLVSKYEELLATLTLPETFSFDDAIAQFEIFLNSINIVPAVDDLNARLVSMDASITAAFDSSPLQSFRTTTLNALETVRTTIEGIPTEQVQEMLETGLGKIQEQINALHLNEVKARIEAALKDLETFILNNINDVMKNKIETAINQALSVLDGLSLQSLLDQLNIDSILDGQVRPLFDEIQATLDTYTEKLKAMLARLDELSFKPVGNVVVKEIDGVAQKLKAINPTALSEPEKLAIKGAVAIIQNINLEQIVADEVKGVYHQAEAEVKGLLNKITDLLDMIWQKVEEYGPDMLLVPINDAFAKVSDIVDMLKADILFDPLYGILDKVTSILDNFAPENLLDPLQEPYNIMMDAIKSFDPAVWLEPVQNMYQQIIDMIGKLNPGPIFDELEAQKDEFFASLKESILDGLNAPGLPPMIFDRLRPMLTGIVEAVLSDPKSEFQRVPVNLTGALSLSKLFAPLDGFFEDLLDMMKGEPLDTIVTIINRVYEILDIIAPQFIIGKLREAQNKFFDMLPSGSLNIGLPFDVAAINVVSDTFDTKFSIGGADIGLSQKVKDAAERVSNRFKAVIALIDPTSPTSTIALLTEMYNGLIATLRGKIDELDITGAQVAYDGLVSSIKRLLPAFLRQPLTAETFLEGMRGMRPSVLARPLERTLNRLIGQLEPIQITFENSLNNFLMKAREILDLINPLSLREPVQSIFDTIMSKIPALDLGELATRLRDMLIAPLEQINPAGLKPAIGAAFDNVMNAITSSVKGLLDLVRDAVDRKLAETRQTIHNLIDKVKGVIDRAVALLKDLFNKIKDMIFTEILGRLQRLVDNLGISFDQEVDRVVNAFKNMLAAIPV